MKNYFYTILITMKYISKILCFLFLFFLLQAGNTALSKEVKFIFITDTHINPDNAYKLQDTVKEINSYKDVDFVVFGGNNIQKANVENLNYFLYLAKRVHKKTIVLLGNQDVFSTSGITKDYYMKRVRKAFLYRHPKKTNFVFKKKNIVFVVMDGSKQYFKSANGFYPKDELIWLDKTLKKYEKKNVVILQHFPLLEANSEWVQTAGIEDYYNVLKKHSNVKAIVSGHYNFNKEVKIGNIYNIVVENYTKAQGYKIIQFDFARNFIGTYLVK